MEFPTISQYAASVADPAGLTRTLGEFKVKRDNYGEVEIRCGNNASVFRIDYPGYSRMLKCYTRPRNDLRDLYAYIAKSNDPLFPQLQFLPGELFVFDAFGKGVFRDVLVGKWSEGITLEAEIGRACREYDRERLALLSENFDRLAWSLLSRPWAHGDLKPENIIVDPQGGMSLVDFDALYYPGNPNSVLPEVGTPGYQHPLRDEKLYEKCLDDYPVALISVSLKVLSVCPDLYTRFNRSDIIIMNPMEIVRGTDKAYDAAREILANAGCFGHYRLSLMLCSAVPALPGLSGVLERMGAPVDLAAGSAVVMENGLFGYQDTGSGRIIIEPVFEEACPYRDGGAYVSIMGKRRVLSPSGTYLFSDLDYDDIKPLSEGYAAFCRNGKWGYVAGNGETIVPPRYDAAGNIHFDAAPVSKNGKWGYIDVSGKSLTDFIYDRAYGFRDGTAKAYIGDKVHEVVCGNSLISRK